MRSRLAGVLLLAYAVGCTRNPSPDENLPPYRVVLLEGRVSDLRSGTPLDSVEIALVWFMAPREVLPLGETTAGADGGYRLRVWVHPHLDCEHLYLLARRHEYLSAQTQSGFLRCNDVCQRVDVRLRASGPDSVPGRVTRGACRRAPGPLGPAPDA